MMYFRASRRHCSDEILLAYADGELSRWKARQVRKHLCACWNCRARAQELEEQVQSLSRGFASVNLLGPHHLAKARNRLFQRVQSYEANPAPFPRFQLIDHGANRPALAASAALLLLVVGGPVWLSDQPSPPPAEDLIGYARQWEGQLSAETVHQRLTVELVQEIPRALQRSWSVDVWADGSNRRFALQWKQPGGLLEYALWRPDAERELVYKRAAGAVRPRDGGRSASLLLTASATDLDRLEASLMRWLEGRSWRSLSLASDFAAFASEDGVILSVQKKRAAYGRRFFQISARQESHDRTVEAMMQIDATTFRPHLLSIRLITPTRHLELRLIVEGVDSLAATAVTAALFEPDIPLVSPSRLDRPEAPSGHLAPRRDAQPRPSPILPSGDWIASLEMEIRYALHRVGACLGEPLELRSNQAGGLSLHGVVSTEKRKEELLRALAALEDSACVEMNIKSAEQLVSQGDGFPQNTGVSVLSVSGREMDLYFQQDLENYFRASGTATPKRMVTEFMNRAVSISDDLLTEAWALRRLAERYGAEAWQELQTQSRWLLEMMARDHLRALGGLGREGRLQLDPVLSAISGRSQRDSGDPAVVADLPWDKTIFRLFHTVEQIQLHVTGLFAGAGLPVELVKKLKTAEIKSPQRALEDLLADISSLEGSCDNIQERIAAQFSVGAHAASQSQAKEGEAVGLRSLDKAPAERN